MSDVATSEDSLRLKAEKARLWHQDRLKQARADKLRWLAIAAVLVLLAAITYWLGVKDWPWIVLGSACIPLLMYVDARGQEGEVRELYDFKLWRERQQDSPDGLSPTGGESESKPANAASR